MYTIYLGLSGCGNHSVIYHSYKNRSCYLSILSTKHYVSHKISTGSSDEISVSCRKTEREGSISLAELASSQEMMVLFVEFLTNWTRHFTEFRSSPSQSGPSGAAWPVAHRNSDRESNKAHQVYHDFWSYSPVCPTHSHHSLASLSRHCHRLPATPSRSHSSNPNGQPGLAYLKPGPSPTCPARRMQVVWPSSTLVLCLVQLVCGLLLLLYDLLGDCGHLEPCIKGLRLCNSSLQ